MKKILYISSLFILAIGSGCKKYLDVNDNPNGPSSADPALYLPSIQSNYALGIQFDARALAPVVQNFQLYATTLTYSRFEQHGYIPGSDASGDLWRNVYWKGGQNLQDLQRIATEQKKWDLLGAGLVLEAWGWQMLTDYHGELVLSEAYDPAKNTFNYDSQEAVYAEVKRLCLEAIENLNKTTDAIGSPLFSRFDLLYKGNRDRWKKFAYGILAINEHHKIKKANYDGDAVIKYADSSFTSNSDDALVPFLGTSTSDASFFGPIRGNFNSYGQSAFIVKLTDGSLFGGAADPRRNIMLSASGDGAYRGLPPFSNYSTATSATPAGIKNIWGLTLGATAPAGTPGKYLFQNNAPFPLLTYSMLQFLKAEAAHKKGYGAVALQAYQNGVNASMDFVRRGATGTGATTTGASFVFSTDATVNTAFDAQRTLFFANPAAIPATPAGLTQQMILLQKYIALWGYGFIEAWVDLRRFDYDPAVFTSFTLPTTLYVDNGGKPAYRMRPRYNSEYVWNIDALTAIGGFAPDFHTKKMWIQLP